MSRLFIRNYKIEHTINIIAEFTKESHSLSIIAKLSDYISSIYNQASVTTDLQSHPTGYRIAYSIKFYVPYFSKIKNNKYNHYVAKLSNWLDEDCTCLQRYVYNYV